MLVKKIQINHSKLIRLEQLEILWGLLYNYAGLPKWLNQSTNNMSGHLLFLNITLYPMCNHVKRYLITYANRYDSDMPVRMHRLISLSCSHTQFVNSSESIKWNLKFTYLRTCAYLREYIYLLDIRLNFTGRYCVIIFYFRLSYCCRHE